MATGCQTDSSSDDELRPMTDEHKNNIQSCRSELVNSMEPGEVLDYLLAKEVLSQRMVENIKGKDRPDCEVNEALVSAIVKKSEKAYRVFVAALENTCQKHLANLIIQIKELRTRSDASETSGTDQEPSCPIA